MLSASETTPIPSWRTDVAFKGLLGVFYREMYTTKSIATNQSLLFEGTIRWAANSALAFLNRLTALSFSSFDSSVTTKLIWLMLRS